MILIVYDTMSMSVPAMNNNRLRLLFIRAPALAKDKTKRKFKNR